MGDVALEAQGMHVGAGESGFSRPEVTDQVHDHGRAQFGGEGGGEPARALPHVTEALVHLESLFRHAEVVRLADEVLSVPGLFRPVQAFDIVHRKFLALQLDGRSEEEAGAIEVMTELADKSGRDDLRAIAATALGVFFVPVLYVLVEKVRGGKGGFGYNAQTDEYEDLVEAGVIEKGRVRAERFSVREQIAVGDAC